jgi:hypothetical protein
MSNVSSDSLSYKVPEMLSACASLCVVMFVVLLGIRSVDMGGGMKGLTGMGLGIRGDTIDTRSGSLMRLVDDFEDSNRTFASRLRKRFGGGLDSRADLEPAVELLDEYERHMLPCRLLKKGTMYGTHAVHMLAQTCTCVHIVEIQRSYSGLPCGVTW